MIQPCCFWKACFISYITCILHSTLSPHLPIVRSNVFAFLFRVRNLRSDTKEMKSPGLLSPSFTSGPREKHAPCKAELPRPRHPCRGGEGQSAAVTTVWISLCGAPDKQRGKVQRSGSASEMWEGQQALKCMGTGGNLILLQRGEGALHHVKIIASGQQSMGVREGGLAHWPACRRTLTLFFVVPAWMCRGHASTLLWVLTETRDWTRGLRSQVPREYCGGWSRQSESKPEFWDRAPEFGTGENGVG